MVNTGSGSGIGGRSSMARKQPNLRIENKTAAGTATEYTTETAKHM
eukprot:CAMPEP_0119111496 /NCGR_PEP_ID=MMETSP1180-20130426/35868_1 /TAXON_ID=3052 ORGANISM="Chlamydomonas cf sp, Strain CCMP681" /NCGR_SAMPLE_ID=MMETSP1180 /ASSEMBLY_ACC=CAM_ASM_000741 /LENGTH=45 /DNA_ID= /DNA_START= /DNA_END= /DNA_ORIENTATION=